MNIYTIYKATNKINGKVYIGFDSNWPLRKQKHKNKFQKLNLVFYDAIKKYGWDNFQWDIIYQSLDGEHTLNVMENYFIKEYRSFTGFEDSHGYNMTLGGEGVLGLSGDKSPWYGRKHTEDSKKLMSLNSKGRQIGRIISDETKIKISQSMKGQIKSPSHLQNLAISKGKEYKFYNPSGEMITINNLKHFCMENRLSYGCMRQLIYGKAKQHKGWKYHF